MTITFVFFATSILVPADSTGISSCTATACHGGPAAVKGKEWNSSYTIWQTRDPHADAYATLTSERSRSIVARLAAPGKKVDLNLKEYLAQHCVACHATVGESRHLTDGFAEDGVSCASCHGLAGEWLGNGHAGRLTKGAGGMANTKDLVTRAKVCVDCHVGSPDNDSQPGRDVNHDLIAAGHPRLNFEFAAYLASLPAHWDVDKDRKRVREAGVGNFAAEAWATGQLVAAHAALELLESRAKAAGRSDHDVWPEFSESSCYACHHDLRSPSFRQQLFNRETPANRRSPLGSLAWGTWYFPMPRLLMAQQAGAANNEASWNALEQAMSTLRPDSQEVVRLSSSLRRNLTPLIGATVKTQRTAEWLTKGVMRRPAPGGDWDEVVQWYLAAVARHQALQEQHAGKQQREQALRDSQETLEKIRGTLESPHEFDPTNAAFRRAVDRLLQQFDLYD